MRSLVFFALLLMPTIMMAQDDDLYFVPEKPVKQSERRPNLGKIRRSTTRKMGQKILMGQIGKFLGPSY